MNTEEDEFRRIEREALRRAARDEDDDTQVYAKPWVGLTDEEVKAALVSVDVETKRLPPGMTAFARAVEAKLKERNHG